MHVKKILKNTKTGVINEVKGFEIKRVRLNLRSFWISSSNICKQYSLQNKILEEK